MAVILENWLTKKPHPDAPYIAAGLGLLLLFSFLPYHSFFGSGAWMAASGHSIFERGEYWRLWTSLFAHGDFGHLAANSALFIPLTYLLSAYFGPFHLPLLGILLGGLINLVVLFSMPPHISLIGISGVVSWMAAAWLTLFVLVDRRERPKRKAGAVIFLTLFLFVPETLKPQVSYYSHFVGYLLGIISGLLYFLLRRSTFRAAEIVAMPPTEDGALDDAWQDDEIAT